MRVDLPTWLTAAPAAPVAMHAWSTTHDPTWTPADHVNAPSPCPHPIARAAGGGTCLLCEVGQTPPMVETPRARRELSPEQRRTVARRASAVRMRRSLSLFVQRSWHVLEPDTPLEWSWHHDALCDHVQAMLEDWIAKKANPTEVRQRMRDLVINLPPGTAKSRILMVHAVAWMWLRCPSWKVLCVSSNPENVKRDAELCRDLAGSPWYRDTFAVVWTWREDVDSKAKYQNTRGGQRLSRGLIAKFTGIRADAIFDDDLDDAHDVFGEASRKERESKYKNSIYNRLNDKRLSIHISLQQRVHEDDHTAARLRDRTPHLSIPLEWDRTTQCDCPTCGPSREASGDDTVHTPIGWSDPRAAADWTGGTNLHPVRFPEEDVAAERVRLGDYAFECQYNQRPGSLAGGWFLRERFRFFRVEGDPLPHLPRPDGCTDLPALVLRRRADGGLEVDWTSATVDCTFGSKSAKADSVGLLVVSGKGADRFIRNDRTAPRNFPQTCDAIATFEDSVVDGKIVRTLVGGVVHEYPEIGAVLIEKAANGQAVIDELEHLVAGLLPIPAIGSKESRAAAMMPAQAAGNIYLPEGAPWLEAFLTELSFFPKGKHDDRVDALAQLVTYYRTHTAPVASWLQFGEAVAGIPGGRAAGVGGWGVPAMAGYRE